MKSKTKTNNTITDADINEALGLGEQIELEDQIAEEIGIDNNKEHTNIVNINKLLDLFNKYYLSGMCNVSLFLENGTVQSSDDITKSLRVKVTPKDKLFETSFDFGFFNTKQLIDMCKLFSNEVKYEIMEDKIILSDSQFEMELNMADESVIPDSVRQMPKKEKLPKEYLFILDANKEFCDLFLKSKTAIKDERLCKFKFKKDKLYMMFGSEETKSNLLSVDITKYAINISEEIEDVSFLASTIQNILSSNKDSNITMKIHSELAWVIAKDDNYIVDYWFGSN